MPPKLRWGILGAGNIARKFARDLPGSFSGELAAVAARSSDRADAFAKEFGAATSYAGYSSLLHDESVDAVYIATLNDTHAPLAIAAARAGKHVLCEKPFALNAAQAAAVIEIARDEGVVVTEAFMYRLHPQTLRLLELIQSGTIGDVERIDASFGFEAASRTGRLFENAQGGGALMDVGCYPVSAALMIAGAVAGAPVAPVATEWAGIVGDTDVDEEARATLKFTGGLTAQLAASIRRELSPDLQVSGSEGTITVPRAWTPTAGGEPARLLLERDGRSREQVVETDRGLYAYEADSFAETVAAGAPANNAPSPEDTVATMSLLDRWREAIGLQFKPERIPATVSGTPLAGQPRNPMRYGSLLGVDIKVSRVALGFDYPRFRSRPHAFATFDAFFERGGNCFDTGFIYQGGEAERVLGEWVETRAIRDQVVIIAKGAHTPRCFPEMVRPQLELSLERLRTSRADLYLLHRDNPAVPAAEFVEALNEAKRDGLISAFGGSNWAPARIDEANRYAAKHGLAGFTAASNNFSLARQANPIWPGVRSSSGPEDRAWFQRNDFPLVPWSSQARGFFVPCRAHPDDRTDDDLVRGWYSEDNFERLRRCSELAERNGVHPNSIALAYVLAQPFPTFPIISALRLVELRTSLDAFTIELTPADISYLDLRDR